jgi:3-hydroxybutyryl-CoA dehydrogenase
MPFRESIRNDTQTLKVNFFSDFMKVVIVGAGSMGAGIAQVCASFGHYVSMTDIEMRFVEGGIERIKKPLAKRVSEGKMTQEDYDFTISRVHGTIDLKDACKDADLVIEAVIEEMPLKKKVFGDLDRFCKPEAILASNTSSLSITEIASATKRPDKVIGMHFFNPAPVMKLVELIRGASTSIVTMGIIRDFCLNIKKTPVEVAESAGFVVNRLLIPMINEAFFLLMEGVASREDIDSAMKLGANMPMGPLELADFVGIDVCLYVMEILQKETGDPKFRPSPLMRKHVRAGRLGRKTGAGIYEYR